MGENWVEMKDACASCILAKAGFPQGEIVPANRSDVTMMIKQRDRVNTNLK